MTTSAISPKREAFLHGEKFYYTGEPCSQGHISHRRTSTGACTACLYEWRPSGARPFDLAAVRKVAEAAEAARKTCAAMSKRMRSLVASALSKRGFQKASRTAAIIGCTWVEFARHIELQFLPGMSWDNRHLWHIDHIVPLASASTEADVIALNHFTNLRPLWALDNLAKSDTVTHLI